MFKATVLALKVLPGGGEAAAAATAEGARLAYQLLLHVIHYATPAQLTNGSTQVHFGLHQHLH
jgi:hypothetical protein